MAWEGKKNSVRRAARGAGCGEGLTLGGREA